MENSNSYIYKKEIDWSVLHQGFTIPIKFKDIFYKNLNLHLEKGERKSIKLLLNSSEHPVTIVNINFDAKSYPNHKDLIRIRYSSNSTFAVEMREVFSSSYQYIQEIRENSEKKRKIAVPDAKREYIAIYGTPVEDVLFVDSFTQMELLETKKQIARYTEMDVEQLLDRTDERAEIVIERKLFKVRKLNRAIGEGLKRVYRYQCQICGEYIGEKYDVKLIHTHHIVPFSESMDNDPDNIMVVCPNHHSIIHSVNPEFDRKGLFFTYPNGYIEHFKLNKHL